MKSSLHSESPCVVSAMRAAARRMTQLYDEALAPVGLRITQYHLLSELDRRSAHPPTVSELAEILVMERSALGQTLRPLARDGLIEISHDKDDGRRRSVKLSKAGADKVATGRRYWAGAHKKFEGVYGKAQLAFLRETLRDIAENPQLPEAFE